MSSDFEVTGANASALFTLKLHRGEGMVLIAMNWKTARPPDDFVGFAVEYREPDGDRYYALKNRLAFRGIDGQLNPNALSTITSPLQKFRWVHFPRNSDLAGDFSYRVSPVFMDAAGALSYGDRQEVAIQLRRETYPGLLNVAFTRGFVSSQAFVDRYQKFGPIAEILPTKASEGLDFEPSHPKAKEALSWMGFEARQAILEVLDKAIADTQASVRIIAYDLNLPDVVTRLEALGPRVRVIIDDSGEHATPGSAENAAEQRLKISAGAANVKRQHVLNLQHNKMIVVDGPVHKLVVCGSTNFSWRGFYVQANNAVVLSSAEPVAAFSAAFEQYWQHAPSQFGASPSADWKELNLTDVRPQVTFSPHGAANKRLAAIAADVETATQSSLLYSLAFLFQTSGPVRDAIGKVTGNDDIFVYGISDRKVGGLDLQRPGGNVAPVFPDALSKDVPAPFSTEPTGGGGIRMHHKFIVIDFDKPTARVYLGSYNFSSPADVQNGENLLLFEDRRVAVSYMVEALRIFDHYHFRIIQREAATAHKELVLIGAPKAANDKPWWLEDYENPRKIRDRELFS